MKINCKWVIMPEEEVLVITKTDYGIGSVWQDTIGKDKKFIATHQNAQRGKSFLDKEQAKAWVQNQMGVEVDRAVEAINAKCESCLVRINREFNQSICEACQRSGCALVTFSSYAKEPECSPPKK